MDCKEYCVLEWISNGWSIVLDTETNLIIAVHQSTSDRSFDIDGGINNAMVNIKAVLQQIYYLISQWIEHMECQQIYHVVYKYFEADIGNGIIV